MERANIKPKFKGLINGKVWKSGNFKLDDNGLAVIFKDNHHFYVFKDSVSRFTGYVNSLGQEIFEGDLLAVEGSKEKQLVFWDENCQQWKIGSSPLEDPVWSPCLENCLNYPIVGHIYTHQHLLSSPKEKVHPKKGNKLVSP